MSFEIRVECKECGMIRWADVKDRFDAFQAVDIVEDHEHRVERALRAILGVTEDE